MSEHRAAAAGRLRRFEVPNLVAGLVIGALVAGGVAPLVGSDRSATLANDAPGFLPGNSGTGSTATTGTVGGQPGTVGGQPGAASAGPGSTTSTTGGNVGVAPGSATGTSTPSAAGRAGAVGTARTASDVGITKDTIRIGAATLNCKACAAFGVDINEQPNRVYAQAYVDDINNRGGINGRKLELYTADYDPVQDGTNGGGTERAACLELTANKKVFAVVQGVISTNACFYDEHKTPLITGLDWLADDPNTFNRASGRLWILNASGGRQLLDFARQLDRQQLITKTTKWGLVDVENTQPLVKRHLLGDLKRLGYTPAHVSILPGDVSAAAVKVAQEVPAMRAAGVTHVLITAPFIGAQMWVREASRNGWKPQYRLSDFPSGMDDYAGGQIAQGGDFKGAIALSSVKEASTLGELRRDPVIKGCFDTYERFSGKKIASVNERLRILSYCNTLRAFELAAKNAGVNPTRQSIVQALAGIGQFPLAGALQGTGSFGGAYSLGAVKWSAEDFGQRKVWQQPCPRSGDSDNACWVPVGPVYRMAG